MQRIEALEQERKQTDDISAALLRDNTALAGLIHRIQKGSESEASFVYARLRSDPHVQVQDLIQHLDFQAHDGTLEKGFEASIANPEVVSDVLTRVPGRVCSS